MPIVNQKPFMPTGETKIHSTPGDNFGTFTKEQQAFSALLKKPKKGTVIPTGKNFVTKNPKKGGPGYKDICIGPYPAAMKPPRAKKPHPPYGKVLDGPLHVNMYPEEYFDKNPYPLPPKMKPGPEYKAKELFSTFAAPAKDPYVSEYDADKILSKKYKSKNLYGFWCPQSMAEKTMYTISTIPANAFRVTVDKYATAEPQYTKYLL
ncbi:unnamed protein product [Brassicogethes aeneus]|uniref:Uncharacterized protein n=1 Tax=Brassicogethes aeneus TaxID=1431903 RepID=A0A9P0APP6_BRAAE|nr:unnamed protein product [Brassicogethes aeneus]